MQFGFAIWGSRGEVEPCVAVGRELVRRGHEVRIGVPPDSVGFAESAGLAPVEYGPELPAILDACRDFWTCFFRTPWRLQDLNRLGLELSAPFAECWRDMNTTLTSLGDGVDLLFTSLNFEQLPANIAEYYNIPLATLHWFPMRANGQLLPFLPASLGRFAVTAHEWMDWSGTVKQIDDEQRRELGLPKATRPWPRRITQRGSLEIQAYDEVCFPGLAAEWAEFHGQRPFVGTLTMEMATDTDSDVSSWIAAGTPPIFFGFGSIPVQSPAATHEMISSACEQLGQRALIGSGCSDFSGVPRLEHVKVVDAVNFAAVFPACRAVVHHGGSGTTAIGLRAGVPTLILSTDLNQTLWGAAVRRLRVGTARRFSTTTRETLTADLRTILDPQYATRARELATQMTHPAESVVAAADLVENFARCGASADR
jgi:UDP:flavonoid glycosyltransferase YjiC (YdhE family)